MSTLKVDGIRSNSATSDAITLASNGTCTANITNNLSNRNKIINGGMQVAQRGTSSTTSGYGSVDRYRLNYSGTDEAPTHAQVDVASGTTPYTLGFRKALKITNGNQTSGAGSSDFIYFRQTLEAQDIANSGWNYLSSSSYITLSYWIKSSVAQNFYGYLQSLDGTNYSYVWETGSLSADTWTKITKTIPGNSNLVFNNDTGGGLDIMLVRAFDGTDRTASMSLNGWATYSGTSRTPDQTSTWYTTNDATLEVTGVQLEVGSVVTDFEHKSFGQELALCQRYYQVVRASLRNDYRTDLVATFGSGTQLYCEMRATPTATTVTSVATQDVSNVSYGYISNKGFIIVATGIVTTGGQAAQQAVRDVGLAAEV